MSSICIVLNNGIFLKFIVPNIIKSVALCCCFMRERVNVKFYLNQASVAHLHKIVSLSSFLTAYFNVNRFLLVPYWFFSQFMFSCWIKINIPRKVAVERFDGRDSDLIFTER